MRILLDSNIWRYILDGEALSTVQRAVRQSQHSIVVAPAILYEAAHTPDKGLRDALLSAMALPLWKRLMPEAYWEAEEIKAEVRRLRPEWLRPNPDLTVLKRVRYDWKRSRGGVWDCIRQRAELLQRHDAEMMERARDQAYTHRQDALDWPPKWRTATLTKSVASLPAPEPGWNGEPFEPWRYDGLAVFINAMATKGHPWFDWLGGEVNLAMMQFQRPSLVKFWLHDVETLRMPRHWLRWGFEFLQRLHKVTEGTPVDTQLGTYLVDVDLMLSADRNLVFIAERCRADAPFPLATSRLLPGGRDAAPRALVELLGEP